MEGQQADSKEPEFQSSGSQLGFLGSQQGPTRGGIVLLKVASVHYPYRHGLWLPTDSQSCRGINDPTPKSDQVSLPFW